MEYICMDLEKPVFYPIVGKDIRKHAEALTYDLIDRYGDVTLVCTGSSGLYLATAMKMYNPDFTILYIRKDCELKNSHGGRFLCNNEEVEDTTCVFVDDFISTGATLERVRESMMQEYDVDIRIAALLGGIDQVGREYTEGVLDLVITTNK